MRAQFLQSNNRLPQFAFLILTANNLFCVEFGKVSVIKADIAGAFASRDQPVAMGLGRGIA
jgi:hypothetical protein